jgi:hypothetical protein
MNTKLRVNVIKHYEAKKGINFAHDVSVAAQENRSLERWIANEEICVPTLFEISTGGEPWLFIDVVGQLAGLRDVAEPRACWRMAVVVIVLVCASGPAVCVRRGEASMLTRLRAR